MNFFTGMFLRAVYIPSTTIVKRYLKEGFLRSFFFNFALSVIGNYAQFLFKSCVGNET